MKIIEHVFYKENLGVKDGEIVQLDPTETKMYFSLTLNGLGMFEEEYGRPLLEVLLQNINEKGNVEGDEISERDFVMALACCTYLKIDGNEVFNNEATKNEFKNSEFYKSVASDFPLVRDLIAMSFDCIRDRSEKAIEGKKGKN